jgi:hypothetical protein
MRAVTDRWRYRMHQADEVAALMTGALRRAGYAPGAVVRSVVVLVTWAALLATVILYLVRR